VVYDLDDNNQIDFGDLAFFAPAFGTQVGGTEPPYSWWADYDKSGQVDFGDLAFFSPNFGKSRPSAEIVFPQNYPDAWVAQGDAARPLGNVPSTIGPDDAADESTPDERPNSSGTVGTLEASATGLTADRKRPAAERPPINRPSRPLAETNVARRSAVAGTRPQREVVSKAVAPQPSERSVQAVFKAEGLRDELDTNRANRSRADLLRSPVTDRPGHPLDDDLIDLLATDAQR
jgi:hypothetical protein